jgi:hypothetical protein
MFLWTAAAVCLFLCSWVQGKDTFDNVHGTYQVHKNFHYSNKTTVTWGQNSELSFSVIVTLPQAAALYDCTNTSSYSCEDPSWIYDWNKLWGKARCGYTHDHHEDSDRFVWRRCSDSSCASYIEGTNRIEIATYSYDGGVIPYQEQAPHNLLQPFKYTVEPEVPYKYTLAMNVNGESVFTLADANDNFIESHTVVHAVTCPDNYFEGTVQGLYFGGTCQAPEDIVVIYE